MGHSISSRIHALIGYAAPMNGAKTGANTFDLQLKVTFEKDEESTSNSTESANADTEAEKGKSRERPTRPVVSPFPLHERFIDMRLPAAVWRVSVATCTVLSFGQAYIRNS
jgi:hypothetical protein